MAIWFDNVTLGDLQNFSPKTINAQLGIEFTELGPDFVRGTMPVDERTRQTYGLLHGGANVVLAETLGSTGASLTVDAKKFFTVGVEVNANHLRSAMKGIVTGTARPIHRGRSIQVWGIEIVNEEDQLTCICRLTVAVRERGEKSRFGS
jgi:1,4-dihydroxy-2-naphthoyl-CoA hydrolase